MIKHKLGVIASTVFLAGLLSGCGVDIAGMSFLSGPSGTTGPAVRAASAQPLLTADGVCEDQPGAAQLTAVSRGGEITLGIGECDLARQKGKPTDVLIGESGKGQRETQVLYSEPTGREIYMFTDNKLMRIIKPGQS